jgi:hypothetical protein
MKSPASYIEEFFVKGKRLHLVFCLVLLLVLVLVLSVSHGWSQVTGAGLVYLVVLANIYTGRWLCRKWLLQAKWGGLLIRIIAALAGFAAAELAVYVYFFVPELPLNHAIESSINITAVSFALIFCGFFIAVVRSAIKEKMNSLILAEQQKGSELNLLRSQVSPHFLFNTLNNMYSMAINRPQQMPAHLLQLSELLRYSIYEADQPLVRVKDELDYIRSYIALENIRSSDRLSLTVNLDDNRTNLRIAPLLLIVFVENAFKHARNSLENRIEIDINCKTTSDTIFFKVSNTCGEESQKHTEEKRRSGFGIANVIKRLNLLYPDEYELKQVRLPNEFKIELNLKAR